jgi:hypothetical protein
MQARVPSGDASIGTIIGYPLERVYEEVAFLAYHFHWSLDTIMNIEHSDRRMFIEEISRLNQRANEESRLV